MKYIELKDTLAIRGTGAVFWIEHKHQNPAMSVIIDAEIYNNNVVHLWKLLRRKTVRVPYSSMNLNI